MKVFVTGATGLIGTAVIPKLAAANHEVTALVRAESSVEKIKSLGAKYVVVGDNESFGLIGDVAKSTDAVLHMAFDHDIAFQPGGMQIAAAKERKLLDVFAQYLHPGAVLIIASGSLANERPDELSPTREAWRNGRDDNAEFVKELARTKGLKTYIAKLAPITHSHDREHPFISHMWVPTAKKLGAVPYISDGSSVWPAASADSVADLLVLAINGGAPAGSALNAVTEGGITHKQIAETIGKKIGLPTKSVTAEEAAGFGFFGVILSISAPTTNELTKQWTGWQPSGTGLIEQIEKNYFK